MKFPLELSSVQLVITVAEPDGVRIAHEVGARTTLGVLTTLIAQAKQSLILAAPFIQAGAALNQEPLASALTSALQRGVVVDIASTREGLDTLDILGLRTNAKRYIRFFQPVINYEDATKLGLHAKFCVADAQRAYVGSANLTRPGLQQHFEMGVLVEGDVASQIEKLWRYLIENGFFIEV